jgi:hypothetical protein
MATMAEVLTAKNIDAVHFVTDLGNRQYINVIIL